jgi:hypothetical protein
VKLVLSKRLFATLITTFILFSLNFVPANAVADGNYNCSSGTFTIASDIVTGNTSCVGSVNIPSGVTSIGVNAFKDNRNITSVVIPDTVLTIAEGGFWGADGITSLTIGNGVTSIGARAFNGANKITTLNIPNSVTTIGTSAFSGTSRLTSLTLGNQLTTIGLSSFSASAITSLIIPDSVITIGDRAFFSAPLLNLTLGSRLTTIGTYAFEDSRITSLVIPDSVITIGERAFAGPRINSLTLGNGLTTLGDGAFYRNALNSVTLPASLTTLGMMVFENGTLVDVNFLGNAPQNVDANAFFLVNDGARANVAYNATGFGANGSLWNRLIVTYGSAPSGDSGSSKALVTTPKVVKTADAIFNLKNKKYLSKNAMKTKLSKNKSFKRNPTDLYKYSIFGTSKKNCLMRGSYVMALKKTGSCDLYATRTTPKGAKYKYWVTINYIN